MADQATLDAMIEKFRVIIKDNNVELVSSINKGVDEKIDSARIFQASLGLAGRGFAHAMSTSTSRETMPLSTDSDPLLYNNGGAAGKANPPPSPPRFDAEALGSGITCEEVPINESPRDLVRADSPASGRQA